MNITQIIFNLILGFLAIFGASHIGFQVPSWSYFLYIGGLIGVMNYAFELVRAGRTQMALIIATIYFVFEFFVVVTGLAQLSPEKLVEQAKTQQVQMLIKNNISLGDTLYAKTMELEVVKTARKNNLNIAEKEAEEALFGLYSKTAANPVKNQAIFSELRALKGAALAQAWIKKGETAVVIDPVITPKTDEIRNLRIKDSLSTIVPLLQNVSKWQNLRTKKWSGTSDQILEAYNKDIISDTKSSGIPFVIPKLYANYNYIHIIWNIVWYQKWISIVIFVLYAGMLLALLSQKSTIKSAKQYYGHIAIAAAIVAGILGLYVWPAPFGYKMIVGGITYGILIASIYIIELKPHTSIAKYAVFGYGVAAVSSALFAIIGYSYLLVLLFQSEVIEKQYLRLNEEKNAILVNIYRNAADQTNLLIPQYFEGKNTFESIESVYTERDKKIKEVNKYFASIPKYENLEEAKMNFTQWTVKTVALAKKFNITLQPLVWNASVNQLDIAIRVFWQETMKIGVAVLVELYGLFYILKDFLEKIRRLFGTRPRTGGSIWLRLKLIWS